MEERYESMDELKAGLAASRPRYATLAELRAAYESGALSRDCRLSLDHDGSTVYVQSGPRPGDWHCAYESHAYRELLEEALDLLGIPCEGA